MKNLQFLSNSYETWSKWQTHQWVRLPRYGPIANFEKNQIEVVDFESVDFDYKKIENK